MAGIFGDMFGYGSRGGILGGYPLEADPQGGYNSIGGGADEAAMAELARQAAAQRMRGRRTERGGFDLSLLDPSDPGYAAAAGAGGQAPPSALPWLWNQQGGAPAMPGSPQMGAPTSPAAPPMGMPAQAQPPMPFPAQAPIFPPGMGTMGQAAGYGAGMDAPQQPDQAQLPPAATPTIGHGGAPVPAAQQQQQPAAAPGNPGFLDRLGAGLQGFGNGGGSLSGSLEGLFGGLATGQRQDAQGLMERALVSKGLDPTIARAAAKNPMLLQTVLPAAFGTKLQPATVGVDVLGHNIPGTFNSLTGKYYDVSGKEINSGSNVGTSAPPNVDPQVWAGMTPDQRLDKMPPSVRGELKAIYEGRQAGTGRNVQQLLPLVNQVWPDFTMQDYKTALDTRVSYTSGEGARGLRSAGTTITHGVQLRKAIDDLHNFTLAPGLTNRVTGEVARQYDPKYQEALKNFTTNAELYAKELDFALTGKSTVSGAEHLREMFSPWASPEENGASLKKTLEMLNGRLEEHAHTYNQGTKSAKEPLELLPKKDADALNRLIGGGHAAPVQGSPPAVPRTTGGLAPGTYNWTPQSGAQ